MSEVEITEAVMWVDEHGTIHVTVDVVRVEGNLICTDQRPDTTHPAIHFHAPSEDGKRRWAQYGTFMRMTTGDDSMPPADLELRLEK